MPVRASSHHVLDQIADELSGLLTSPSSGRDLQLEATPPRRSTHSGPPHAAEHVADWELSSLGQRYPGEEVLIATPLSSRHRRLSSPLLVPAMRVTFEFPQLDIALIRRRSLDPTD